MHQSVHTAILIVAVGAASLSGRPLLAQGESDGNKSASMEVSVDEIGKSLILIGRLKKPLGTLVTVRGKWSYPDIRVKDYSLRFTVTHVDGEKLKEPLEFNVSQLKVVTKNGSTAVPPYKRHKELVGVEWTLRAYETGSIEYFPESYFKETASFGVPYYYETFTSRLNGVLQQ